MDCLRSLFEIDMKRFESGMTCMANAIYFFHFKAKWNEALEILAPSARYSPNETNSNEGNIHLAQGEVLDDGSQKFGENQDIFFFQFIEGILQRIDCCGWSSIRVL